MIRILRPGEYQGMKIDAMGQYSQSTLGVFDQDQKFHGLFNLYGLDIDQTVQNQPRKSSDMRLTKSLFSKNDFL